MPTAIPMPAVAATISSGWTRTGGFASCAGSQASRTAALAPTAARSVAVMRVPMPSALVGPAHGPAAGERAGEHRDGEAEADPGQKDAPVGGAERGRRGSGAGGRAGPVRAVPPDDAEHTRHAQLGRGGHGGDSRGSPHEPYPCTDHGAQPRGRRAAPRE